MQLAIILDMVHSGFGDRPALSAKGGTLSYTQLVEFSWAASSRIKELGCSSVIYIGTTHLAYPVALFGAAGAGVPFIPLNYRLGVEQLSILTKAHPDSLILYEGETPESGGELYKVERQGFVEYLDGVPATAPQVGDEELPCVLLYTSGTSAAPKAALLRQRHLMAYLLGSVEFASAGEDESALVSVPPYHVAGVANLLSNLYAGRRIVYLDQFTPESWLQTIREEAITQAMVVPTMLARIVESLGDADDAGRPSLRSISYGGARMPTPVLERALKLFPQVGFVNAYGLTETSSTIALLDPEDHRRAFSSVDPLVRSRLGSVGRLLPAIELEVRDEQGQILTPNEVGLLFLRGDQISGEYADASALEGGGWFPTRDRGWIDDDGYVFIEGRADDTIIRGGENIAPAEIEDVLLSCPGVIEAAVVGVPDDVWGERLAAVVVLRDQHPATSDQLMQEVRSRLRSSKTPETVEIWSELPRTDTGKLLRRNIVTRLIATSAQSRAQSCGLYHDLR
jgi:acyl-CoA synthetase (AMP-forming)/AMP-acid ligase II